jgi:hypothetical protein
MKRLLMLVFAALLSLGVVSLSLAQEAPPAGGQPAAGQAAQAGKATKKPKKKHKKSGKKSKKKQAPAAAEEAK